MKRLLWTVLFGLLAVLPVQAQSFTLGYFATTTGTSATSPLAGATQFTLTVAQTTLTVGATVLIDRTGTNPELLTVASLNGTTGFFTTTGTLFTHVAPFSVDWATTPSAPVSTVTIATATCAAAPPTGPIVIVNPAVIAWNDDACALPQSYSANQAAFFTSVPIGNWWAAISNPLVTGWSNPYPFGRAARPPTTFRVVR